MLVGAELLVLVVAFAYVARLAREFMHEGEGGAPATRPSAKGAGQGAQLL